MDSNFITMTSQHEYQSTRQINLLGHLAKEHGLVAKWLRRLAKCSQTTRQRNPSNRQSHLANQRGLLAKTAAIVILVHVLTV